MVNIKLEKKSITYKLFLVLFGLSASVSMILGMWFINDTNRTIETEMYNMSGQTLNQISNNISILLSNVESIAKRISIDSKLIEILSIPKDELKNYKSQNKNMNSYELNNNEVSPKISKYFIFLIYLFYYYQII
ncbi:hypothetical protein SDC9_127078 [bioreactor metagenome]|uniref:Chemotaxis methyl-accepting receptor HlyB-like 4HB MCP domain-containing protein n=1 Tax=bioreactor metagenome TaxID=1076179 RepID=A0A645CT06_9ZZZZ